MTLGRDQLDQDALAAEWGLALDADGANAEHGTPAEGAFEGTEATTSQWSATVDDGLTFNQSAKGGAERILNQDEIDNLLGFSLADVSLSDNSGIRAIIDSALVSYERLPMLEIVFDRLVRLMTTSLRNFTSDNVEVSLDRITSVRFGDYLNSIPLPAILAVFKAEEWDNSGLITVNSNLIYSIIDVLLQMFMGEKFGRDPIWEGHLATEIGQAEIAVDAVLYEAKLPLKQLMKLEVGDTLMLEMRSDAPVTVRCGDVTLTEGRMGRVGDRVAVRVTKPLRKPRTTFAMFEGADGSTKRMEAP